MAYRTRRTEQISIRPLNGADLKPKPKKKKTAGFYNPFTIAAIAVAPCFGPHQKAQGASGTVT
jgi:hypothetical protein